MLEAVPCVVKERSSPSAKDRPPIVDTPFPFERGNDKVSNDSDNLTVWEGAYMEYKSDLGMLKLDSPLEELTWLLSIRPRYR
uniref:Uncharacterized protein n=1 Tax=Glossina morsitans morsitans TaxID=37546 RepID=A0A1B0GCB7_GLOMM